MLTITYSVTLGKTEPPQPPCRKLRRKYLRSVLVYCYRNALCWAITSLAGIRTMLLSLSHTTILSPCKAFSCSIFFSAKSRPLLSFSEKSCTSLFDICKHLLIRLFIVDCRLSIFTATCDLNSMHFAIVIDIPIVHDPLQPLIIYRSLSFTAAKIRLLSDISKHFEVFPFPNMSKSTFVYLLSLLRA